MPRFSQQSDSRFNDSPRRNFARRSITQLLLIAFVLTLVPASHNSAYAQSAAPANDNFAGALDVIAPGAMPDSTAGGGSRTGTNVGATAEAGEPFHFGRADKSVWYSWQVPLTGDGRVSITNDNFGDHPFAVYTGTAVNNLQQVASGAFGAEAKFRIQEGTTYFIAVDGYYGAEGEFTLNWSASLPPPPPANDNFANAELLTGFDDTAQGTTLGATTEPGEEQHFDYFGTPLLSVWYKWVAPESTRVRINTNGIFAYKAAFTGTGFGNLTEVAEKTFDELSFTATEGTTYYIAVGSFESDAGDFSLTLKQRRPFAAPVRDADRSEIAFESFQEGNGDIFSMYGDGSERANLSYDEAGDFDPKWSPDAKKIIFRSTRPRQVTDEFGNQYELTNSQLYIMNADGTNQQSLGNDTTGNVEDDDAVFSPDGTKIAFERSTFDINTYESRAELFVMNADGSNVTNISRNADPNISDFDPVWSPDSQQIAFRRILPGTEENGFDSNSEVFRVSVTGSDAPVNLTNNPLSDRNPAWSPDGTEIAFQRDDIPDDGSYGNREIFVMNPDGTNQRSLTANANGSDENPLWSPDSTKLVFEREIDVDGDSNEEIFVMNRDGSDPRNVSNNEGDDETAAWSPGSDKLAYRGEFTDDTGDRDFEIFTVNADGSNRTRLVGSDSGEDDPTWKPDVVAPTVTATPKTAATNGFYKSPGAVVTLTATDGNAGVRDISYSLSGAQTQDETSVASGTEISITQQGTTTLTTFATDRAGNKSVVKTETFKVDAAPPVTSYTVSSAGKNITLTVNFRDNLSGYAALTSSVNGGAAQTYRFSRPTNNGTISYTFNGPYNDRGEYTIKYFGTDVAGNREAEQSVTFRIPPQAITPFASVPVRNSNGSYTVTFGYQNDNPTTFNIAVGSSNFFSPNPQGRNQTTAFQPGRVANAFSVTWNGSRLTWTIKGPDGQTRSVRVR